MKEYFNAASMDEMVFEGRNKNYGAYELRALNPKYSAIATLSSVGLFIAAIVLFSFDTNASVQPKEEGTTVILDMSDVPEVELPEAQTQQEAAQSIPEEAIVVDQQRFVEFDVVRDEWVENDQMLTTVEEALDPARAIGNITTDGEGNNNPIQVVDPSPLSYGTGPAYIQRAEEDTRAEDFVIIPEVQPEFEDGQEAMMKFIKRNLKYPQTAIENGIEGTVTLQFIIEKDGSVSDVQVVKDPGGGLGKEAARVVRMMPKWKPGRQRGGAVRVKMSAPVKFKLDRF